MSSLNRIKEQEMEESPNMAMKNYEGAFKKKLNQSVNSPPGLKSKFFSLK